MKRKLIYFLLILLGCGFVDKPDKKELIKKCKKNQLDQLIIVGACRNITNAYDLEGCLILTFLAFQNCEKVEYTITNSF